MWMRRTIVVLIMAILICLPPGLDATAAPVAAECRLQSAGEKPSLAADDIVDCVTSNPSSTRLRVRVAFTYASPLGGQNIWMGLDVLSGGNRLKWFGYRPVPITRSSGTAEFEILYGPNDPPKGKLVTDQIEVFMYVGGGQIFYRRLFNLKHEWQL